MADQCWQRIKDLFDRAVDMDQEARCAFLASECAQESGVRREVEAMLDADACQAAPMNPFSIAASRLIQEWADAYSLAPGALLEGRFEIVRLLGKGGMGEVYEAADRLGHTVAIKIIRHSMSRDRVAVDRFKHEVRLAQRVSHVNVCRIHAIFEGPHPTAAALPPEQRTLLFLTMELLDGVTLKEHLRQRGPFEPAAAIPLARQMAEALAAAHAEGVVHRDFKSANVVLTAARGGGLKVKVTDFGLAGDLLSSDAATEELPAGTPDYMAPEQFTGHAASFSSDVFAFGVVLHEMVTGELPWPALKDASAARQRWSRPETTPQLRPTLPRRWRSAVLRCLDPDPARRPSTVLEAVDLLEPKGRYWTRRFAIGGGLVAMSGGLMARFGEGWIRTPFASPVGSLAVLPFEDASVDKKFGHIAGGLTDELIAALATVPNLRVVARGSVNRVAGTQNPQALARTLKVQALLTGNIRLEGDLFRVSAQLVDGNDGARIWSQEYDHPVSSASLLPTRMASAMATALRLRLAYASGGSSIRRHSAVPRAYELYLLGRQAAATRATPALLQSLQYYEEAVALDDRYALAWAAIAESSNLLVGRSGYTPGEWFPKVERAARKAIELDPQLAEAHLALASMHQRYNWSWDEAERHFELAVQLSPGLAMAHHWYAGFLSNLGYHDRAMDQIRQARELDPLSLAVNTAYGAYLIRAGRQDEAILQLQLVNKLEPKFAMAYTYLGEAYEVKAMWDEAIAFHRKAVRMEPGNPLALADLAYALARAGRIEEARKIAVDLELEWRGGRISASAMATAYKGFDKARALAWLDTAYSSRDNYMMVLKVDRRNDIIRSDPRFMELTRRMRLP